MKKKISASLLKSHYLVCFKVSFSYIYIVFKVEIQIKFLLKKL